MWEVRQTTVYGKKIGDQYQKANKIIPDELQKESDLLVIHRQQADVQRTLFKRLTSTLGEGEVLILADFKENWKLALRQTQATREFYSFQEITHLCLIVYYVDDGQIKSDRTHHLSEKLNHDSFFVHHVLQSISHHPRVQSAKILHWLSDTGSHFRNKAIAHMILSQNSSITKGKETRLHFFLECHGKNPCDSSFADLTRTVHSHIGTQTITTVDQLIDFFTSVQDQGWLDHSHTFISFLSLTQPLPAGF
ncbi:hypothetical protein BLNAU_17741 [Blattamonas nauphoetae]|uniref:Uncharacterized protein n=1 Tax=Blattamonas nauphoetae TaxID=2049346 RepID=A0ABQ9X6F3_9EUKA|nr:hypothetical protein BLNAU_17741 [Blattamonas nauphoetae]